jgi:hypothetical protein
MTSEIILRNHNRPVSDQLHPMVFKAMAGLVLSFALSTWILFDRQSDAELPLAVVSGLLAGAMLLPWLLWRVWDRENSSRDQNGRKPSFRDWAFADFETWQGKQRGSRAAIEALLPIAALAFGLMALGIAFLLNAAGT